MKEYDRLLELFIYKPLWNKLSEKDKRILIGINSAIKKGNGKADTADILEACELKKNEFSPYRKRLGDSSIINISELGKVFYNYPRFDIFIDNLAEQFK